MHADDAVVDLAATPEPLAGGTDRMLAALGSPGFVNAADRFRVSVIASDEPLAFVTQEGFIPLDRFHEAL
jgi:hypothetical protein